MEWVSGVPDLEVMIMDTNGLVSESLETVFHWDIVMTKMEQVRRTRVLFLYIRCVTSLQIIDFIEIISLRDGPPFAFPSRC